MKECRKKGKARTFFRCLFITFCVIFLALFLCVFWLLTGLPKFACEWIEDRASGGEFAVQFDGVVFNLSRGIVVDGLTIYKKGTLDEPLFSADEIEVKVIRRVGEPIFMWFGDVKAKNLNVATIEKWPSLKDENVDGDFCIGEFLSKYESLQQSHCVSVQGGNIYRLPCKDVRFDWCVKNGSLCVENFDFKFDAKPSGMSLTGRADLSFEPLFVSAEIVGNVVPSAIYDITIALGGEGVLEYYDALDFKSSPSVNATLKLEGKDRDISLNLSSGEGAYCDREFSNLNLELVWIAKNIGSTNEVKKLSVNPKVGFAEGSAIIGIDRYPSLDKTEITARGNLYPDTVAKVVWDRDYSMLTNFVFASVPSMEVRGTVYDNGGVEFQGNVSIGEVMAYGIPLKNIESCVAINGNRDDGVFIDCTNLTFMCFDGASKGNVRFTTKDNLILYDAQGSVTNGTFSSLTKYLGVETAGDNGTFSTEFELSGNTDDLASMKGVAHATIDDGQMLRFPFFAGLTDYIGNSIAGVDFLLMASDAEGSATITNGLVHIEDVFVMAQLFSARLNGNCRVNKEGHPVDVVMQLRLLKSQSILGKLLRLATLPVSKLMEFRVTGPIADTKWDYLGLFDRLTELTFWPHKDETLEEEKKKEDEAK